MATKKAPPKNPRSRAGAPARRTARTRGAPDFTAVVHVEPARELARLEREIEARVDASEVAKWDAGRFLQEIARRSLHQLGHPKRTIEEYAAARFPKLGATTLKHYRRVAVAFTREAAKRHTVHKLWLGLRYLDATPEDDRPAELLRMDVRLADGTTKAFADVTAAELERAIERLGGATDAQPARLPRGAGSTIAKLQRELAAGRAKTDEHPRLTVRVVRRAGKARALATIHDIELDALDRVGRALQRASRS